MRLVVNALSIGSLSGRHAVFGFLRPLSGWVEGQHEILLLSHESEPPPADLLLAAHVRWLPVADRLRPWWKRTLWEMSELRHIIQREGADFLLNASGAAIPTCPVPQATLAMNPWCFVRRAQSGLAQAVKATMQRRAYRHAMGKSVLMLYISDYLRGLYETLSPRRLPQSEIAHVGLDDETHLAAASLKDSIAREPLSIVSVSAMAPWKGIETLIEAMKIVRKAGLAARLTLVGPWPDARYERSIRRQIVDCGLQRDVTITGHVAKNELHWYYAQSRVFCLMSHCESYGIPAAEALAFGTPVVASAGCAIPEICVGAGLFGPAGDASWTAKALITMLSDDVAWNTASINARRNAAQLRWEKTARPLLRLFSVA
jgi:glycosyltransferase involved in cell wall biosynthesis